MRSVVTPLRLSEHGSLALSDALSDADRGTIEASLERGGLGGPKLFNNDTQAFVVTRHDDTYQLTSDYLIGADWVVPGRAYVQVVPKVDRHLVRGDAAPHEVNPTDESDGEVGGAPQVHYLKMLMAIVSDSHFDEYFENLFHIDFSAAPLPLPSDEDLLTPLLVARFIQVLRRIVNKGLRKSYYTVTRNLSNRVKGKVLVSLHIKENVFKSRVTSVRCQFDTFGENTLENRFLKEVLRFARRYVEAHGKLFGATLEDMRHAVRIVSPAFECVDELSDVGLLKHTTHHPFYGEYKEAIRVGKLLLQRFGYTITSIDSRERLLTPPFWINMPALFEMYVCAMMRAHNPERLRSIHYHFSTWGNELDILAAWGEHKVVIDAKYKLRYGENRVDHEDIRQVAGYARLRKVRAQLGIADSADDTVDCLIVYPHVENGIEEFSLGNVWAAKREVPAYHRVWTLGVRLPVWSPRS